MAIIKPCHLMGVHRKAFRSFLEEALDRFDSVEAVTLFGSVAEGTHGSMSDIDVLVEGSSMEERTDIENLAFSKASEFGVAFSPLVKQGGLGDTLLAREIESKGERFVRG